MQKLARTLLVGCALLSATPIAAQTFPTDDPVIRRIYAEGMDSSRLEPLAHALTQEYRSNPPRYPTQANLIEAEKP